MAVNYSYFIMINIYPMMHWNALCLILVFTVFRLLTDIVCLYTYEFCPL